MKDRNKLSKSQLDPYEHPKQYDEIKAKQERIDYLNKAAKTETANVPHFNANFAHGYLFGESVRDEVYKKQIKMPLIKSTTYKPSTKTEKEQEQQDYALALSLNGMNQSERGHFSASSNQNNEYPKFFTPAVRERVLNPVIQQEKPISQTIQNPNHANSQKKQEEEDHEIAKALDAYFRGPGRSI